jgi:hypothetical protein
VTLRVSGSEYGTLNLSSNFSVGASSILGLLVTSLEGALAHILEEVACFSSSEPVVGHELNVGDSRFSCLTVTFDET